MLILTSCNFLHRKMDLKMKSTIFMTIIAKETIHDFQWSSLAMELKVPSFEKSSWFLASIYEA